MAGRTSRRDAQIHPNCEFSKVSVSPLPSLSLGREQSWAPLKNPRNGFVTLRSVTHFPQRALQPLDAQGCAVCFSCCSINASSPSFSGDHTSWSLPGSGMKKQERCKFILSIQKQPWDALSCAGNFVYHKVKPGWCFLNPKSHLVTDSQRHWLSALWDASYQPRLLSKPAGLGCSFQNPTEISSRKLWKSGCYS